ncbi:MAG: ABC transporter permease [Vicinamibacterales bacterium]|jgi:predicted permease|nr:ABC transporter permease [Vicinamibacterales bacterium]
MLHDFRYAARRLLRSRGFTAAAVLTLALGIGANTAVFTVINTVLLGELPVPEPDRVVKVYTSDFSSGLYGGSSYPDFADYRDRAASFTDLAAYTSFAPMNLGTDGGAERIQGAVVTRNFFEILNLRPAHGRFFPPGDDTALGSSPVAVLSYELWQRSFDANPMAIGQEVTLNGSVFSVIGVAPNSFRGVSLIDAPALWVPMSMVEQAMPRRAGSDILAQRGSRWLQMVGRLTTGVTLETARAEVATLAEQLAQANPSTNLGTLQDPDRARPVSILPANVLAAGPIDNTLLSLAAQLLMAVVSIVLLITCANVANLLLARASTRHREIAVRQSLGASRRRLLRQLLTESMLLASLGGGAGLLLGMWAARLLHALVPDDAVAAGLQLPDFALDWRVLAFTAGLSLATGVLFGLAPALQSTRPDLIPSLKDATSDGRAQRSRLRGTFVVAQVALSLVLLIGAGLFVRSLQTALATSPGFNSRGVLLAALDLSLQGYDETRGLDFYARLIDRVGSLPGVEAVSVASVVPVNPSGSRTTVQIEDYAPQPQEDMELNFNRIGPGYFRAMGIAVVAGRVFGESAIDAARDEVVVNETFARRYWPGQDPIGRGIRFGRNTDPHRVIGVVQDGKYRGMREDALPYMYRPLGASYTPRVTLLARTDGDPMAMLPSVRAELRMLDSTLPIYGERTLAEQVGSAVFGERLAAMLLGVFGAIALLLATVGIYGLVANAVEQRTHEIGVRMALGADRRDVMRLVVGQGMGLVLVGVGLGLAGAVALTRAVASLLFGVSPTDATTFALAPVGLMVVALLACLLPARRATRIDPMQALRYE